MNKHLLSIISLLPLAAFAGNTFTIHSSIPGMTEGAQVRLQAADSHDSIAYGKVTNGQFTLTGKVAAPVLCTLEIDNKVEPLPEHEYMRDRLVKFYLDNDDYTVSAPAYDSIPRSYKMGDSSVLGECRYTVKGGKSQAQYQAWHDAVWPSLKASEEANVKAWHYLYGGKEFGGPEHPDKATGERMSLTADSLKAVYQQYSDDYAWAHPAEPYSLYLQGKNLDRHFYYTAAQLDEMVTRFRGNSDATCYAAFVKKVAEAKKTAKDMAYPNITLRTTDGKAVKLSSLVKPGKYTLLDFWASWCGPCRASIPLIKEMHAKHPELNIVSISCDKSLKDWAEAMKEENMPWKQVALPQDKQLNRASAYAYQVQFIPYLIVISPDGKVVKAINDVREIQGMW
ncbi:MAG: thioredoxin-like domain-containing protein [Prevotella sp.]